MDHVKAFCDQLRDRLVQSIESATCLTRREKSVLQALWARSTVKTQCVEEYCGDLNLAREVGLSPRQLSRSLFSLEQKGFIKPTGSVSQKRQLSYLLNAMLLEAAYDETLRFRGRPPQ
jgi:DNA-binding MarR family transcriptional regulator